MPFFLSILFWKAFVILLPYFEVLFLLHCNQEALRSSSSSLLQYVLLSNFILIITEWCVSQDKLSMFYAQVTPVKGVGSPALSSTHLSSHPSSIHKPIDALLQT